MKANIDIGICKIIESNIEYYITKFKRHYTLDNFLDKTEIISNPDFEAVLLNLAKFVVLYPTEFDFVIDSMFQLSQALCLPIYKSSVTIDIVPARDYVSIVISSTLLDILKKFAEKIRKSDKIIMQ